MYIGSYRIHFPSENLLTFQLLSSLPHCLCDIAMELISGDVFNTLNAVQFISLAQIQ